MFLSVVWIENRCLSGALLQMSDAVDQMRPTAHEEFQRHQREKQGQWVKAGKRRKRKQQRSVCLLKTSSLKLPYAISPTLTDNQSLHTRFTQIFSSPYLLFLATGSCFHQNSVHASHPAQNGRQIKLAISRWRCQVKHLAAIVKSQLFSPGMGRGRNYKSREQN